MKYTENHVWVLRTGEEEARIGITDNAQGRLGAVVSAHLPRVGEILAVGQGMGQVKSAGAAFDVYAPLSGKVVAVNDELALNSGAVNDDPYGEGWLVAIDLTDTGEPVDLLGAVTYERLVHQG
ncbi:hypothetical protein ADL06_05605 [Streptomyces sp. NRRL F-6491]|nr:hypothetical protein ADL06_05605 [Streptomyces sp. NRRL F-6491]KOX51033.1 hypothetical protein ADL08_04885 [Streptomyces sp. NRRL F-6492]